MPAYPDRTCLHCGKKFPRIEQQYGNQPLFCSKACQLREKAIIIETGKAKCGRCHNRYDRTHNAQRFCPDCAGPEKCKMCGKPTPPIREDIGTAKRRNNKPLKAPRKHIYCSRECQELAWLDKPLPICRYCQKEVPLPTSVFRNPPKLHYKCHNLYNYEIEQFGIEEADRRKEEARKKAKKESKAIKANVPETYDKRKIQKYLAQSNNALLRRYLRDSIETPFAIDHLQAALTMDRNTATVEVKKLLDWGILERVPNKPRLFKPTRLLMDLTRTVKERKIF